MTAKVEQKRQFWHTSTHTRTYICSALNAREANASFKAQRKKEEEVDNRTLKDKTADALRRLCFEREEPRVCRLSEGDRGRGNGTAEVQWGVVVEKKNSAHAGRRRVTQKVKSCCKRDSLAPSSHTVLMRQTHVQIWCRSRKKTGGGEHHRKTTHQLTPLCLRCPYEQHCVPTPLCLHSAPLSSASSVWPLRAPFPLPRSTPFLESLFFTQAPPREPQGRPRLPASWF